MLQTATIAAPTLVTAPSTPRTPKQNRKSGISIAIQNQNNNSQTKNNATNLPNSNNNTTNNNNNGRQKRNPAQTHARHQSMPAQSRLTPGSPSTANDTIKSTNSNNTATTKRSSASVATPAPTSTVSSIQIQKNQQVSQGTTKLNNNNSNNDGQRSNQKNRSSSQVQQNSQKNKRNQRRKETDTTADSTFKTEMDTAAHSNQSPTLNPSTPPSSTDSDDSESAVLHLNPHPRPAKGQNNRQNAHSSKGSPHLSGSLPQRPNSAPTIPQPRKGMTTPQKQHNNSVGNNPRQQSARKPSFGSASHIPLDETDPQLRPNMAKASSADEIMLANRVTSEKKAATLYAGPTFHKSPDPTSLPIPAFSRPLGTSPAEPHTEKLTSPFFGEAAAPQLNNMRPQRTQSETTGWMSHHSMPGMSPYQLSMGQNYNFPDRMTTSSYTMEITQSLRSILKIQSQ
ncbi:hypothetical protein BGX27_009693 [Mortierella sp. AM989]|nr:hypothetical protein BGX27_009693 [Mortierella sp. AM989]